MKCSKESKASAKAKAKASSSKQAALAVDVGSDHEKSCVKRLTAPALSLLTTVVESYHAAEHCQPFECCWSSLFRLCDQSFISPFWSFHTEKLQEKSRERGEEASEHRSATNSLKQALVSLRTDSVYPEMTKALDCVLNSMLPIASTYGS